MVLDCHGASGDHQAGTVVIRQAVWPQTAPEIFLAVGVKVERCFKCIRKKSIVNQANLAVQVSLCEKRLQESFLNLERYL